jgi:hypothetical protein
MTKWRWLIKTDGSRVLQYESPCVNDDPNCKSSLGSKWVDVPEVYEKVAV